MNTIPKFLDSDQAAVIVEIGSQAKVVQRDSSAVRSLREERDRVNKLLEREMELFKENERRLCEMVVRAARLGLGDKFQVGDEVFGIRTSSFDGKPELTTSTAPMILTDFAGNTG